MRGFLFGLLAAAACAQASASQGIVFNDLNGDGRKEPAEPGLAGIEVSNGQTVVLTDADGRYRLPEGPEPVFVVVPSGWAAALDADNRPVFFRKDGGDFGLHTVVQASAFKVLVFTDTQPASDKEVGYLEKTVVAQWAGKSGCAFGVTLGDITYDRPDFFPKIAKLEGTIGIPWHSLPGNHDLGLLAGSEQAALADYTKEFGPSTYAFRYAHTLFIAIDDVRPRGGPRYVGGLLPGQLTFIGSVLSRTEPGDLVVLMLHIPLFPDPPGAASFEWTSRAKLFALLKGHDHALVLSSHTHVQRHVLHGPEDGWEGAQPLHEYNVAAACGGFWGGVPGSNGLPPSTMWDGTPPGSAVVSVDGNQFSLDYFPSELPHDHQLSLWVPAVIAPKLGYVAGYANVFNGYKGGWTVEWRVDDRNWLSMNPFLGWDPGYAQAFLNQDRGPKPAVGTRLPDPVLCNHLWRAYLPGDLSIGTHAFQVRAIDPQGRSYTESKSFEIAAR